MTSIAGFSIEKRPVLIGDLMLSGPELSQRSLSIPTIGDSRNVFPEGSGTVLTGLIQKVNVLSDNFMIAWAGRAFVARTVIRELNELASREPLNLQKLDQFLECFRQSKDGNNAQFIGCLGDSSKIISFGLGGTCFDTPRWGQVRTAGSGGEDIQSLFRGFELSEGSDGSEKTPEYAILRALMISGHLLQVELSTYSPLLQYYGGGYEIAALVNGKFQKIGDITYLFWDINVTDVEVGLSRPYHVVKIGYWNDNLIMRTLRIRPDLRFEEAGYIVPSIFREITRDEIQGLRPPDLNAPYLVNLFLVKWPDGSSEWMSRADYIPPPNNYIVFYETEDGFEISFNNSFFENIGNEVIDRLKKRMHGKGT